jgi:hypothetical protein
VRFNAVAAEAIPRAGGAVGLVIVVRDGMVGHRVIAALRARDTGGRGA